MPVETLCVTKETGYESRGNPAIWQLANGACAATAAAQAASAGQRFLLLQVDHTVALHGIGKRRGKFVRQLLRKLLRQLIRQRLRKLLYQRMCQLCGKLLYQRISDGCLKMLPDHLGLVRAVSLERVQWFRDNVVVRQRTTTDENNSERSVQQDYYLDHRCRRVRL